MVDASPGSYTAESGTPELLLRSVGTVSPVGVTTAAATLPLVPGDVLCSPALPRPRCTGGCGHTLGELVFLADRRVQRDAAAIGRARGRAADDGRGVRVLSEDMLQACGVVSGAAGTDVMEDVTGSGSTPRSLRRLREPPREPYFRASAVGAAAGSAAPPIATPSSNSAWS